ncbi:MAG: dipeptidase PepE [Burkholderiaceae bacterium]
MNPLPLRLLLLSNSRNAKGEYLVHAGEQIASLAGDRRPAHALFIPFAGVTVSWPDYTRLVQQALEPYGVQVQPSHERSDLRQALREVEMVLVGGGNTFCLLSEMRRRGWLPIVREAVYGGLPYVGWSAGSNLACPTIRTTNDMPIVDLMGFDALGLVPFQINAHYTNALPPGLQAETREQRLKEFLTVHPEVSVCALPEGTWVSVENGQCTTGGTGEVLWYEALEIRTLSSATSWTLHSAPGH